MNTQHTQTENEHVWLDDLEASRDLNRSEKIGYALVLKWFDNWRISFQLEPGRDSAKQFWRAQVQAKPINQRSNWI